MKTHARVVVIGGGIFGVSALYSLAKAGWSDVVLCEKAELTSGSTWHAAAQSPNFNGSYNYAKIQEESIAIYKGLEEETGLSAGFHDCGGIRLAMTEEEVDWFKYVKGVSRTTGWDMEIIGPDEIKKLHPFLNVDNVLAGAYTPNDGHLDPAGTVQAMARGARNNGAEIYRRCLVTDINQLPSGEWEVVTEKGNIVCEHVVNAAGCYGPQVGAMVGLKVPYVNMVHCYVVTEDVPEIAALDYELPVIRDPWSSNYLRQEGKSILVGAYETEGAQATWLDGVDWDLENPLFEPDFDRISLNLERAAERFPQFAEVGIKKIICGAITHTPDSSFLGGPAEGLRNFWQFCGTSIGISQGGGGGKFLADWIINGQSELNPREFEPRRYGDWAFGQYALDKSIEDYEMMYAPGIPGEERMAGRPVKTNALYEKLQDKGAAMTTAFGWERPKWFAKERGIQETLGFRRSNAFEAVGNECKAVRERVGIMDLTSFAKFYVKGKDANSFLNRVCANAMPKKDGKVTLAHMLTEAGRIESEVTVTRIREDHYYLLSSVVAQIHDYDWLTQHINDGEDVIIEDMTDAYGMLLLTGPKARDVLSACSDADLSNEAFPWLTAKNIDVGGITCYALRVSYAGELGWELHHSIADIAKIYDTLWAAGEAHGIGDFGAYAFNSLRMEKAYKGWGSELTTEITMIEADIERFARMSKDDFIGKSVLEKRKAEGHKIQCIYMSVDVDDVDCRGNEPLLFDGKAIGVVTSG
ncbi:MAG: GcvT family protein, partial [Rhodospirillales bacterium]|nr:GcvT family protein [Rhodospirillales bacterium]